MPRQNELVPAGLPAFEKYYLGWLLKLGGALRSDQSILSDFRRSTTDILNLVDEIDLGVLSQPILIPRLQGIEHSSRNWSVLMVLEHLSRVNKSIMEIIRALRSGNEPFEVILIENFKPDPAADADAIDQFRDTGRRYWSFAKSHHPLRTTLTHNHPWFGPLDGHAWHFLAAAHQRIHRRQIYKILALIGVA